MNAVLAPSAIQQLDRRRVYIFPTRAGFTYGAFVLVILLGAINYDNALAYLLAFLLGGLTVVAMLHTYRNLAGLRFTGARAAPVFAGDDARFECHFDNLSRLPRMQLWLAHWPRQRSREERRFLERYDEVCDLAAASSVAVPVRVATRRRGWLALERLRVQSVYPLGILRSWAYFDSDCACLVYPAPRGNLPLPWAASAAHGASASSAAGLDEFAGLRPYVPGDPLRAVAWKSLAQARELMVKRFHGQGAARVLLSWNAAAAQGGVEARLSQLTRWTLDAQRAGLSYALELPAQAVEFGSGREHLERCLRTLALFEAPP